MKKNKNLLKWVLIFAAILFMEAYYIGENHSIGDITRIPSADAASIRMEGTMVAQQFICRNDHMEGIILRMDTDFVKEPGAISVYVKRNGEIIAQWSFDRFAIENGMVKLMFEEPVEGAAGERFEIWLECGTDSGVLLNVGTGKGSGAENLFCHGAQYDDRSLCYGIILHNISGKTVFGFIALFTAVAFGILLFLLERKNVQIEVTFAVCYILLGVFLLAAIPVFKTPDEINHFFRSYEISEGHLLSEKNPDGISEGIGGAGRELPKALSDMEESEHFFVDLKLYDVFEMMEYRADTAEREFVGFGNTALYAPGTYLPQSIGICITRLFTDRIIVQAYGARLFNWIVTGILLFFSLRFLPVGKKLAFLIILLPMNVQQYNSMSPDAFTFALCMAMTAFVLDQRMRRNEKMGRHHYLLMYMLVFLLCQCKVVYLPMCLLLFLIPWQRFGSRKAYYFNILGVAVLGAVTFCGWMGFSSAFLTEFRPGVDTGEQISYVLHQPIEYIKTLIRTIDAEGDYWIRSGRGEYLGWLTIETSFLLLSVYGLLIWIYTLFDNDIKGEGLEKTVRFMLCFVAGIVALLVCTSLYLQWTPLRKEIIEGVQGRYFLPLLFPVFLALKPKKELINNRGLDGKYMYASALGINLIIFGILITYAL